MYSFVAIQSLTDIGEMLLFMGVGAGVEVMSFLRSAAAAAALLPSLASSPETEDRPVCSNNKANIMITFATFARRSNAIPRYRAPTQTRDNKRCRKFASPLLHRFPRGGEEGSATAAGVWCNKKST